MHTHTPPRTLTRTHKRAPHLLCCLLVIGVLIRVIHFRHFVVSLLNLCCVCVFSHSQHLIVRHLLHHSCGAVVIVVARAVVIASAFGVVSIGILWSKMLVLKRRNVCVMFARATHITSYLIVLNYDIKNSCALPATKRKLDGGARKWLALLLGRKLHRFCTTLAWHNDMMRCDSINNYWSTVGVTRCVLHGAYAACAWSERFLWWQFAFVSDSSFRFVSFRINQLTGVTKTSDFIYMSIYTLQSLQPFSVTHSN